MLRGAVDRFNHRRYGRPAIAVPNPSNGNANDQNQSANASEKFVSCFNVKKYSNLPLTCIIVKEYDYEPVDNCINSVLNQEVELTDEFKAHYEKWLEMEVYNSEIRLKIRKLFSNQRFSFLAIFFQMGASSRPNCKRLTLIFYLRNTHFSRSVIKNYQETILNFQLTS